MRSSRGLLFLCAAATACDEVVDVQNLPPSVEVTAYCRQGERFYFAVAVRDAEETPLDLMLRVRDGDGRFRAGVGPTGDGATGLASVRDAGGRLHLVEWGAGCPAGECADPCAARPVEELDTSACRARPNDAPGEVEVEAFVYDGDAVASSPARTLSLDETCPR